MRRLILPALLLAACAPKPAPAPVAATYRNPAAVIASNATFDARRFADVWHVVQAFGADSGCGPLAETWTPTTTGFRVTGTHCGPTGARAFAAEARVNGPGRITRSAPAGATEVWVLWVDADYRIAALGAPDGSWGRIVARSPSARGDLLKAAREAMDFNGFDVSRLRPL